MSVSIALIGCGEAGAAFSAGAGWKGRAFDIVPSRADAVAHAGLAAAAHGGEAVSGADIVLSLVTADAALSVAGSAASAMKPQALFCDFNSVAPDTKRSAAAVIAGGGGRYVDVAVMAPVDPARRGVPLLLSGPDAAEAACALAALGFTNARVVGPDVGRASAIKMIRSVMVKGIEALTDEMMAAADAAGVTKEVLASLDASERSRPWAERADYNLERMATHGLRRAEEMEQAVATLRGLGIDPTMTASTVRRQRGAAGHALVRSAA